MGYKDKDSWTASWGSIGLPSTETIDFLNLVLWQGLNYNDEFQNARSQLLVSDTPLVDFEILGLCDQCVANQVTQSAHAANVAVKWTLHPILSRVVFDILDETDDPSLAWQALVTLTMRSAYYDWLPAFSMNDTATTTSVATAAFHWVIEGLKL